MYQCLKCGNSNICCKNNKKCNYVNPKKMQHMFSVDNLLKGAFSNALEYYKLNINGVSCYQCKYCRKIFENEAYLMYHLYYNCQLLDIPISKY